MPERAGSAQGLAAEAVRVHVRRATRTRNGTADWERTDICAVLGGGEVVSRTGGEMTHVVEVPGRMERYLPLDCEWF